MRACVLYIISVRLYLMLFQTSEFTSDEPNKMTFHSQKYTPNVRGNTLRLRFVQTSTVGDVYVNGLVVKACYIPCECDLNTHFTYSISGTVTLILTTYRTSL